MTAVELEGGCRSCRVTDCHVRADGQLRYRLEWGTPELAGPPGCWATLSAEGGSHRMAVRAIDVRHDELQVAEQPPPRPSAVGEPPPQQRLRTILADFMREAVEMRRDLEHAKLSVHTVARQLRLLDAPTLVPPQVLW